MELHPPHRGKEGQRYIHVRAVNNGTSATTITHFCGYTAKTQFHSVTKNVQPFIIMNGNFNIPFKLKPGEEWTGLASQDDELFQNELLYLGIIHNQKQKPIYIRVKISP